MSGFPLPKGLSQLDFGGVLKNSHEIKAEALRTIDIDNLVGSYFTRADVTYNAQGSATSAIFYYDKNNHIELIQVVGDSGGSLSNLYFLIDGPRSENLYYIWYNVDGNGVNPNIVGRQGIEVPIASNDPANIVALATKLACSLNSDLVLEFLIQNLDNKVKFEGKITGSSVFDLTGTGFYSEVISLGITEIVKEITLPYTGDIRYVYNEYNKTFDIYPDSSKYRELFSLLNNANWMKLADYNKITPSYLGDIVTLSYFQDNTLIGKAIFTYTSTFVWEVETERYLNNDDGSILLNDDDNFLNLD